MRRAIINILLSQTIKGFKMLPFIKQNNKLKQHLRNKISQYLKALETHHSRFTPEVVNYLIKNGYFRIPFRVLLSNYLRLK